MKITKNIITILLIVLGLGIFIGFLINSININEVMTINYSEELHNQLIQSDVICIVGAIISLGSSLFWLITYSAQKKK